jgi:CubicO group peptidase (beta-lactamase class C family)
MDVVKFQMFAKTIAFAALLLAVPFAMCKSRDQCESTPEQHGMDASVLSRGLREIGGDAKGLHSLIVARNGCVVLEAYWPPYDRNKKHYLNSATKSVLSTLVGIAIQDGRLKEDDLVAPFVPDYVSPSADSRLKKIAVKHLLTMSSGISWPQTAKGENASVEMDKSPDWIRYILNRPMTAEPGTVANYSNGDAHLLSAVLQKATGSTALEFARRRLFEPMGIDDVAWNTDPQGRNIGSAALQMRPIDMLKFGLLYLNDGEFDGRRIVDTKWVESSLTTHVKMPTSGGPADYGLYWWLYPDRKLFEAWGGAGQRIGVFRDLGIVVVITADMPQDIPRSPLAGQVYDLVRQSVKSSDSLRANPSGVLDLERAVAELTGRSLPLPVAANEAGESVAPDQNRPSPQIARLAEFLVGDWNTTETMERGELFPNGGERHGIVHVRLAAGGTTLIYEVHSDGSAGKLDGMLVIWWDNDVSLYRFFICFNNPSHSCKMRGTAHWQGDSFVNDYEERVKGKKTSWRDSFTFTPTTHVLVAAIEVGGTMQTLITTKATRR